MRQTNSQLFAKLIQTELFVARTFEIQCFVNADDLDVRDDGVGDVHDGDHGDVHGDGARDVHELHHEWRVRSFRRYFRCGVHDFDHGDDHGDDHDGGADYSFSNTVRCDT